MYWELLKRSCSRLLKAVMELFANKTIVIQKGDHSNNINISGNINIQQENTYNNKGDGNVQQGNNNAVKR